jgi:Heavy metal binding domain
MRENSERVPAAPRSIVLVFRLLLLVLAAGALATAGLLGAVMDRSAGSRAQYVCPMHPEVTSAEGGVCPVCRMELERISTGDTTSATIRGSTYQAYDTVRSRGYGPDVRAPAWVEEDGVVTAILYTDELAPRGLEQWGAFFPSSAPAAGIEVRSTADAPESWDGSTSRVHFRVGPSARPVQPGEVGWLKLAVRQREAPVIPYSALLEDSKGPYVLVASADGHMLTKRSVEIGRVFGGMAAVLSGLKSSERVLFRSAFFLDAERRLRRESSLEVAPR